jgi:hypothetical protein
LAWAGCVKAAAEDFRHIEAMFSAAERRGPPQTNLQQAAESYRATPFTGVLILANGASEWQRHR